MLLFSVVNYKNYKVTREFIDSFLNLKEKQKKLIVWDNSTDEKEFERLKSDYERFQVVFYSTKENLGYFGGAFNAYHYFIRDNPDSIVEYFVVCNNDLQFEKHSNWSAELNLIKEKFPKVGVVAPKILSAKSKKNQNPFLIQRPNKLHYLKWKLIFSHYLFTRFFYTFRKVILVFKAKSSAGVECIKNSHRPIYAAQGACFIFTERFLSSQYDYSDIPFLYCEEITVAEHCRSASLDIVTSDAVVVNHTENVSTSSNMTPFKWLSIKEAQKYILENYYK
ncbi:putative rhamnosyl transferase [Pseudoalteromonas luteoviolacea B = ATCC 29581]|nr:putative rhamnosyl transferase [Pseudoalteromonas luteoviolacea B = ATCC 29581]